MTPLLKPDFTLPANSDFNLIQYKNFCFNRIKLGLLYYPIHDIYIITIYDTFTTTPREFSPYGIFMKLEHAQEKFNSIQL